MARRWPVLALAVWSGYVWSTRIANAWGDDAASTSTKVTATALSVAVIGLALAALVVWWRARHRVLAASERGILRSFAGVVVVVWIVRGVQIAFADYSAQTAITNPTGFKVVHLVLAAVSIALAALVWRVAGSDRAADDAAGDQPGVVSPPVAAGR